MAILDRRDLPADLPRKWDGTPSAAVPLAREVAFDLRSLNESKIQLKPVVTLSFDLEAERMPTMRAAMSDRPDVWISLPAPPSQAYFRKLYPDAKNWPEAFLLWSKEIAPYNGGELLESVDLDASSLTIHMSALGIIFPPQEFEPVATERYVISQLKALLAKCHR